MTVRLVLRAEPEERLDLSALVPERLAGLAAGGIERLPIGAGRRAILVGDQFRVMLGDGEGIVIEGGSSRLDRVGEGMASGTLILEGAAGLYAGRRMRGGRLTIRGSAGHWAASGLRGGMLEIVGDCGDGLGGPLAGEVAGMAGGMVLVRGNAGARAGDRLRRGLIVVEGEIGDYAGSRMIAGTLVACGAAGMLPGTLMRRGTLVLGAPPALPPTFVAAGRAAGRVFETLLQAALRPLSPAAAAAVAAITRRYAGDMASLGLGEVLVGAG